MVRKRLRNFNRVFKTKINENYLWVLVIILLLLIEYTIELESIRVFRLVVILILVYIYKNWKIKIIHKFWIINWLYYKWGKITLKWLIALSEKEFNIMLRVLVIEPVKRLWFIFNVNRRLLLYGNYKEYLLLKLEGLLLITCIIWINHYIMMIFIVYGIILLWIPGILGYDKLKELSWCEVHKQRFYTYWLGNNWFPKEEDLSIKEELHDMEYHWLLNKFDSMSELHSKKKWIEKNKLISNYHLYYCELLEWTEFFDFIAYKYYTEEIEKKELNKNDKELIDEATKYIKKALKTFIRINKELGLDKNNERVKWLLLNISDYIRNVLSEEDRKVFYNERDLLGEGAYGFYKIYIEPNLNVFLSSNTKIDEKEIKEFHKFWFNYHIKLEKRFYHPENENKFRDATCDIADNEGFFIYLNKWLDGILK